ncbi:M16 family metallopeptidase [Dehalobacterium formicoaceticum]|uniref:Insulinase family protein n=1 Tax=Dehalobacterium formicoaceticum TaxID=51515 RepID=A0ABT1Y5S4_9FIRM|nr:pitrilysin family protein [Dehalobacterium formicoaceticum]MCR6545903.1 insulinase family protein [Dehalobacterium formicoaceticum]
MLYKDNLANGIRVITEEIPFVHSVSIGIWVGTGSRHEEGADHGISHFLEHMLFKGTKNRTAKQIAESLEIVGGQINAFTSKEYTCYYAKVLNDHFDLALDVLADMFLNSLFTLEDLEKERNVILEEIKMYEDTPDELVHDVYTKTVWQEDPLGQSIIGTVNSVEEISREQLVSYYQNHYVPQNVVIAVAGNIKRDLVLKGAETLFSKLKGNKVPKIITIPQSFNENAFVYKEIEQMHLCLGFPGIPSLDDDIYALTVLNNVLGGGLSSRLFQKVREERGLSYSIYSFHSGFSNSGLFGIYAGTSAQNAPEVVEIILEQIDDIKNRGITKEELANTKEHIKGTMLLSLENVGNRMNRLGKSEICYDRIITPEEVVNSVLQVTNEDVAQIAHKLFVKEKLVIAAVGAEKPQLNL